MFNKFRNFFKGHSRTIKAKKNIFVSFILKGISIVVGFLMVRITLNYLDQTKYGIWLTLASFLTWFSFFEIGLGSGLKNKLAEALAKQDYQRAKTYVSTTYMILSLVIGIVAILFFISNFYIDWTVILNTEKSLGNQLTKLSFVVFGFFFLRFVLKLIGIIFSADQRPAIANSFGPIGNIISLFLIFILTKTTNGNLLYLGWIMSAVPILVLIIASIYFYSNDYKNIAPSFKYIDFKYLSDLLNLGFKFFLIQISTLIMFQSSNIIITQFYGPAEVTPYNIAFKLFSVIMMIFTIIVTPFWAAFTEAWVKEDITWIKSTIRNLFYVWIGLFVLSLFLFFISDIFFDFWIGKDKMETIKISNRLKISLLIYFLILTFGGIFNMFINGVGKISFQMYSLLIGSIIYIPLSIYMIKYLHWGIESVVIAAIISNFYSPFIAPIQYFKIINKKAYGIWNK